jgi:hypothetical protein
VDKLCGFEKRIMGSGVEPGGATAEQLDVEFSGFEITTIEVGYLEFTARRGGE